MEPLGDLDLAALRTLEGFQAAVRRFEVLREGEGEGGAEAQGEGRRAGKTLRDGRCRD